MILREEPSSGPGSLVLRGNVSSVLVARFRPSSIGGSVGRYDGAHLVGQGLYAPLVPLAALLQFGGIDESASQHQT